MPSVPEPQLPPQSQSLTMTMRLPNRNHVMRRFFHESTLERPIPTRRVRPAPADACLVNLHLPRTGGTTLRQLLLPRLLKRIRPDQIFLVDMGPESDSRAGTFADLAALSHSQRAKLRFICGHMPPDVMDLVPKPVGFAVMRSPLDRALSLYWYCYHATDNPAHEAARQMGPAAFCTGGFGHASNGQARYLSGAAFESVVPPDDELLSRAQIVFDRLAYVGTWEAFPQTLNDIATLAGVPRLDAATRLNGAKRLRQATPEECAEILAYNRVDATLYAAALQRQAASSVRAPQSRLHGFVNLLRDFGLAR